MNKYFKSIKHLHNKLVKKPDSNNNFSISSLVETTNSITFLGDNHAALAKPQRLNLKQNFDVVKVYAKKFLTSIAFKIKNYNYSNLLNYSKLLLLNIKPNRSLIKKLWVPVSFASFIFVSSAIVVYPFKTEPRINDKYKIFSSRPLTTEPNDFVLGTMDSRARRIDEVFREYNCPLEGLGETFVREADKNNIPWWLVAAVSFQESSCGKKTPEPEGLESYNAWGWGVYGDNTHSFDNWVRGIERVSRYMSEKFYSQGVSEPCAIMKTYTPPSQGSWCEGVMYFGDQFINYKTPDL